MNHLEVMYFRGFAGMDEQFADGDLVWLVDPIMLDPVAGNYNAHQWEVGIVRGFTSAEGDIYAFAPVRDPLWAVRVQCGESVLDHCELFFYSTAIPF